VDEEAAAHEWQYVVLYHSHPDAGAYFSTMDRQWALTPGGRPLWDGVGYLVVSVRDGRADEARLYTWDPASRDFHEGVVALPAA
jgi:proteasome lid subunit RPN8/RPN11